MTVRVLLDMDEVLADFVGAACEAHGVHRRKVLDDWPADEWSLVVPLSAVLGRELSEVDFWQPINNIGSAFWEWIDPLPWWSDLVELVSAVTDDWHIVTSPSLCPTCYDGKVKWIKRYFGVLFDRFAITPHKYIFAGPNVILIDDRPGNIEEFELAGGRGILFPGFGNRLRDADPLLHVKQELRKCT